MNKLTEIVINQEVFKALAEGETLEYFDNESHPSQGWASIEQRAWFPCEFSLPRFTFRKIVKGIPFGDYVVPEPVRERPEPDDMYYLVSLSSPELHTARFWTGDMHDVLCLERGLIHKTKENCVLTSVAILGLLNSSSQSLDLSCSKNIGEAND